MSGIVQVRFCGGFGNQLHQYCAVWTWASRHGARFECPDWVGARIFDLHDPSYSCELPAVNDGGNGLEPSVKPGQVDVNIGGHFMMQRWAGIMDRSELKSHLRVAPHWLDLIGPPPARWYIAAHVREGDYLGHHVYANLTDRAYERACEEHGLPIDHFVWVRQSQPRLVAGMSAEFPFLPDFVTLMRASVLLRSNSSFSWWAAVLGDHEKVFSPVVDNHVGWYEAPFVEGNWPRVAHTDRAGIAVEDMHMQGGL